ncbi:hypothetical protein CAPTEDRAFT_220320 [Capitella teleta]|uniref:C2H2-type domain-containing protein n=1 Tax=Capitella teleta TaxID=283909 RepID=R7TBL4_CAPTE|nr:hypothetical protein CAPTEDRAFT_220320 [Capitella teleta]|eukprot:ELT91128.1 hypothetical protein CAPTEDRAFT_220320 [Capitella teleta]
MATGIFQGIKETEQLGEKGGGVAEDSLDHRVAEEKPLMRQSPSAHKQEQNVHESHTTEDDEEDDFRPLIIDTSASEDQPLPTPSQHLFPSFQMDATPFTVKTEVNSMGTLLDYLEGGPGERKQRRMSVSSACSSLDIKASSKEAASTKGTAPSKTRRKSDRILPVPLDDGIAQYVCPICKDCMDCMTDFTKHIRSHNSTTASISSPNSCTICGKVLSSQSSLDRHMLVHSGERPFKCNLCNMSFTTNGNMHRHMRIHEKEMAMGAAAAAQDAPPKAKTTPRKSRKKDGESKELLAHLNSPPPPPPPPPALSLKRRIETPIQETPSPAKKPTMEADPPMAVMTQVKVERTESPYVKLLSKPSSKDDNQSECPFCLKTFLCAYGLDTHMRCHGQKSSLLPRCHACNVTFRNARLLHQHNLSKHTRAGEKPADPSANAVGFQDLTFLPFSCNKFPVVAKAFCERHWRQSSSSYHGFQCPRCDHAFPCASALKLHREAHAPEFPSTCVLCDVIYGTRQEFYQHMASQHGKQEVVANYLKLTGTDDNALQDIMSKEEFLLVLDLKVNRDDAQSNDYGEVSAPRVTAKEDLRDNRDYFTKLGLVAGNSQADKPDLAEITKILQLTSNVESMSSLQMKASDSDERQTSEDEEAKNKSESEGPFTCIYCDEVFTNDRTYKGHVRGHLGLSPYKCNLCTYSSADKSTLIRHLRTHNGERPFQCLVCDFAFTTKANCERHVRKKHARSSKDEIESSIGYNNFMHEDPTESFASPDTVCKFCGEDFRFFRALKRHLRSHSSCRHKPYACRICGHGFSTKANCIRHVQKQHTHIENNQLEAQIQVNELLLSEEEEEGGAPVEKASHLALRAHLAKKFHFNSSPFISNGTFITSPPVDKLHLEEVKRALPLEQQPLDLSHKDTEEQPMDLTVKAQPYPILIAPVYRPLLAKKVRS